MLKKNKMNIKFRNRVSLYIISLTSLLMLITFLAVYGVVVKSVYYQIDENLSQEADEIFKDINIKSDSFEFSNSTEWVEREHGTLEANPVYVQIIDDKGKTIETKTYTPKQFFDEYVGDDLKHNYVMLMNDPSRDFYKLYEVEYDRHVYDGENWTYVNLPIEDIKAMAISSIISMLMLWLMVSIWPFSIRCLITSAGETPHRSAKSPTDNGPSMVIKDASVRIASRC